jgi:broad specificity phosphatase PhoE
VKRITLVRHGQSEANLSGRWQGHGDSPLSTLGFEQATKLGERFLAAGWSFDRVLSSDLSRAASTAAASAERLGLPVAHDAQCREIDVGVWEGLTRPEVKARFADEVAALTRGENITIGGGESWTDLARRAEGAVTKFRTTLSDGEHGVLFAHGGFIASVIARLCAVSRQHPARLGHMSNTSVSTLAFDGERVVLERFNDTAHLGMLGPWASEQLVKGATAVALAEGEHPWYEAEETAPLEGRPLGPLLHALHRRRPGTRIRVDVPAEAHRPFLEEVIASQNVLGPNQGLAHVIVQGDAKTLADFNVGDTRS